MNVLSNCAGPDNQFHEHGVEHDVLVKEVSDEIVFKRYHCNVMDLRNVESDSDSDSNDDNDDYDYKQSQEKRSIFETPTKQSRRERITKIKR